MSSSSIEDVPAGRRQPCGMLPTHDLSFFHICHVCKTVRKTFTTTYDPVPLQDTGKETSWGNGFPEPECRKCAHEYCDSCALSVEFIMWICWSCSMTNSLIQFDLASKPPECCTRCGYRRDGACFFAWWQVCRVEGAWASDADSTPATNVGKQGLRTVQFCGRTRWMWDERHFSCF